MADRDDILPTLDFNGGPNTQVDRLTAAIYRMAAQEIRRLRAEVMALNGDLCASRLDVRGLEGSLARLIVESYGECP